MADFENATPFGGFAIPSADRNGRDLLLIVAAAQFTLPPPGTTELAVASGQPPPPRADEYSGDPANSSLRAESQAAYTRPATDIYVRGQACAPAGQAAQQMDVIVQVGPCAAHVRVFGDRQWERSLLQGVAPSAPALFTRMPLVWERAFGGVAPESTPERPLFEPRNPVGCGLHGGADGAIGKPLPNLEDPAALLTRPGERPAPVGLGPVSRSWQPRVAYTGTYDDEWRRKRAPVWPLDFDERFFNAAPLPLQARPHLQGGERVALRGLSPDGIIAFTLPSLRLVSRSRFFDGREERRALVLDGVLIDTDEMRLTMYYRGIVEAPLGLVKHRETLLRLREPWERSAA